MNNNCQLRKLVSLLTRSALALGLLSLTFASCAPTRTVQFTINSNPQGAYVTKEIRSPNARTGAEFIGNTPISATYEIDVNACGRANEIVLRAMLPGYFDGTKTYTGRGFLKEARERGGIFYQFDMVPSNRTN